HESVELRLADRGGVEPRHGGRPDPDRLTDLQSSGAMEVRCEPRADGAAVPGRPVTRRAVLLIDVLADGEASERRMHGRDLDARAGGGDRHEVRGDRMDV